MISLRSLQSLLAWMHRILPDMMYQQVVGWIGPRAAHEHGAPDDRVGGIDGLVADPEPYPQRRLVHGVNAHFSLSHDRHGLLVEGDHRSRLLLLCVVVANGSRAGP